MRHLLRNAIAVRVPASTSNLGPGFDQIGLAMSLFLEARLEAAPDPEAQVHVVGSLQLTEEEGRWPAREHDVLLQSLALATEGRDLRGLRVRVASAIPIGRGFGSSGAAVAAGLLLGSALANEAWGVPLEPRRSRLIGQGASIEGHPDNVTASILGGCTACVPRDGALPVWCRLSLHPSLRLAVAWPASPLETERARAVLPRTVPLADAVENARRLTQLVAGLEQGDGERIGFGMQDRLHVPYRLPLLPGAQSALAAAVDAGAFGATLSGSGSGLVAITTEAHAANVAEAMRGVLERETGSGRGSALAPILEPAAVVRL